MKNAPLFISRQTARQFILGQQGLWPGRRWEGISGTECAILASEHLQLDPLNSVARSQDITLHSRVINYRPEYLHRLAYEERKFFDWGNWLAFRPMSELPYWRVQMKRAAERQRGHDLKISKAAFKEVLSALQKRGPLGNRDFEMKERIESYRGRKESAVALFRLWIEGKVMTHHRKRFERVYEASEKVIPVHIQEILKNKKITDADANLFFLRKHVAFEGLSRLRSLYGTLGVTKPLSKKEEDRLRSKLLSRGDILPVRVEGWKEEHYVLSGNRHAGNLLHLMNGERPSEWRVLQTTNDEEVNFLAPLDIVSARGRAKKLFDFDYIWEVYKPEHLRKWGYYTLPILWGDRLVARIDPRLDRPTKTLKVLGFWVEDPALEKNDAFHRALSMGLKRLAAFVGAVKVTAPDMKKGPLRSTILTKN